ncbi:MAG: ABC transporter transmembrane domain-containing protein [Chitinophagales bacterium]|nr:ABC transporter transmembrane domain-containing protein [Chitinophagales bacterium]MDW8418339.1 ABC transporter transmembrane domain-containing protein [Chitinophagales bacterium]
MQNLLRLLRYLSNYRYHIICNIVFNLLTVIFSLFSVMMIIPFLQLLFGKVPMVMEPPAWQLSASYLLEYLKYVLSREISTSGHLSALVKFCVFIALLFFLKNLFRFLAVFFLAPIRNGVITDLRNDLYQKLVTLPLSYYSKERKGDIIARLSDDVREVEYSIISFAEVTVREPLNIIIFLVALLMLNASLTAFVLVMLLITGLIIGRVGKTLKHQSNEAQFIYGRLLSVVDETLSGLRIVQAFNAEKFMTEQFRKINNRLYQVSTLIQARRELSSPLTEFLAICVVCMVLYYGGSLVIEGKNLEAETFIGFMVLFAQLIPPAKNFSSASYNIRKGLASAQRIFEVIDAEIKITEKPDALPIKQFQSSITLRNVSFSYHHYDDKKILNNINLTLQKGKVIALVGQSGAGKTTLVDLLPRFYDVSEGEICIDGINIKEYRLKDLRNLFGIVSQESILFNDTVHNNIAFGHERATRQQVEEAARIANAHDFIMKLANGYDTEIGDRGSKLSGGERQRLTIARAVLKNPPILILDEATSSLDSESEKLVQDAITKLMRGRTTIVIAHRLSTIQYADEIIVLQEGQIVERGNHLGLLAKGGIYKKLVDLQAF